MTSPVLFSTGAAPAPSTQRPLIEFKAGKMEVRDKMVHPIKRPGLIIMRQSPDDNLMHFCWKDRQTGEVEDDLILFPEDCEFSRVKSCTTGRVYCLKMRSSAVKMFYWLQEPRTERDDEFCKKVNELLNNPPRVSNEMGATTDRDLQALFGNMTQEQVAQLLSSNGVNLASILNSASARSPASSQSGASASSTASTTNSVPTPATGGAAAAAGTRDMNEFRALISGALMEGSDTSEANQMLAAAMASSRGESGAGSSSQARDSQPPLIDLSTAMNSESLAHLMNDEEFLRQIEPHLPPVTTQQQSSSSSSSSSGQQQPMSSEEKKKQFGETFGLNQACVEAANLGNLEAFVRALDEQTKSSTAPEEEKK